MAKKDELQKMAQIADIVPPEQAGVIRYKPKDLLNKNLVITGFSWQDSSYGDGLYVSFEGVIEASDEPFICNASNDIIMKQFQALSPEMFPIRARIDQKGQSLFLDNPR